MKEPIQESEVNEVLNERHEYFTPNLGSFYGIEVGNSWKIKYAELVSIDYANDFPYLCNVNIRNAISIDGKVASPAKFEERRFNYSGVSEDGKSTLRNLSAEDKAGIRVVSDIDSFNNRSQNHVIEQLSLDSDDQRKFKDFLAGGSFLLAMMAAYFPCDSSILDTFSALSWALFFLVACFERITDQTWQKPSIVLRICIFTAVFFNTVHVFSLFAGGKIGWLDLILSCFCVFIFFLVTFFYAYIKPTLPPNKETGRIFMVGHFNKFITGNSELVVITNKFGSDDNYPMEGYIIVSPEIRNGDSVVKERVTLAAKWNYSGLLADSDCINKNIESCILHNTPEDAKVVMDLYYKKDCVKSKAKTESASEKTENSNNVRENRATLFSKIVFITNSLWSTESGKCARSVLIVWTVGSVFLYEFCKFLNLASNSMPS